MKLIQLLEAPLVDIEYHRADDVGSLNDRDRKILHNYMRNRVYHEKLKKLPFDLYVYVIDDSELYDFGTGYPEGELDIDVEKYINDNNGGDSWIDLKRGKFPVVIEAIKTNKKRHPNAVHFIIGDNYADSDDIALTPWIVVHRLVHALVPEEDVRRFRDAWNVVNDTLGHEDGATVWNRYPYKLIDEFYTFQSAKRGNLSQGEEFVELLTQYLVTGDITLNFVNAEKKLRQQVELGNLKVKHFDYWFSLVTERFKRYVKTLKTIADRLVKTSVAAGKVYYI